MRNGQTTGRVKWRREKGWGEGKGKSRKYKRQAEKMPLLGIAKCP